MPPRAETTFDFELEYAAAEGREALLAEAPRLEVKKKNFAAIQGEIPSPLNPPSGCHFHPRCPHAMPRCKAEVPQLKEIAPLRFSACHLNDQR